jgi:excisionase family DNA binding protein
MEPLVGITEAAKLLGLSPWTVRKLISSRRLCPVRINRRVLLQPEEIRRIIDAGRDNATVPNRTEVRQ